MRKLKMWGRIRYCKACPLLRWTDVLHAAGTSDQLLVELVRWCSLTPLPLSNWLGMSDELSHAVLKVSPALKELDLYGCEWLTNATLAVCALHCTELEKWKCGDVLVLPQLECGTWRRNWAAAAYGEPWILWRAGRWAVLATAEHCPLLEHFYHLA
jgi:hypothetical protein